MDIRYLDMHRLENLEMVYCISILENFSCAFLASAISLRQDTEAFFAVFYAAVRKYGVPEDLVSDNSSVFTSHDTRRVCEQLGIEKKEIKKGRPWQNYIETMFNVQRRMAETGPLQVQISQGKGRAFRACRKLAMCLLALAPGGSLLTVQRSKYTIIQAVGDVSSYT